MLRQAIAHPQRYHRLPSLVARRYFSNESPLKILYGSQTGTAMSFAEQFGETAHAAGVPCEVVNLEDYDVKKFPTEKNVVIITACYGSGQPTDSGKKFFSYLMDNETRYPNLNYAVFGLGSSKTHSQQYNIIGKTIDQRLEALGASRSFPLGLGDDAGCIDVDYSDWEKKLFESLASKTETKASSEAEPSSSSSPSSTPSPSTSSSGACDVPDKSNPYNLIVSSISMNQAPISNYYQKGTSLHYLGKSAMRVNPNYSDSMYELMVNAQRPYKTGDHFGVYAPNPPESVEYVMQRFGLKPDGIAVLDVTKGNPRKAYPYPWPLSTEQTLRHCLSLQHYPSVSNLKFLSKYATDCDEKEKIAKIAESHDDYKHYVYSQCRNFLDVFEEFKSLELDLPALAQVIPPLQPRFYSIASSALVNPTQMRLVFRPVSYQTPLKKPRRGVATTHLKALENIPLEERAIQGFLRTSTFRLPPSTTTPIVMIAGGTGVAPLLGFIEERIFLAKSNQKMGPALLVFGCRSPADEAFKDMFHEAVRCGALTEYVPAYSMPSADKSWESTSAAGAVNKQLPSIIKKFLDGGYLYLCGGASGFATSVVVELKKGLITHANLGSDAAAENFLFAMLQAKRYMEDLAD